MRYKIIFVFILFSAVLHAQPKPNQKWADDKFSMFIHFGLYSNLGGIWQGDTIKRGYSEQIQSFAGIFSDWYVETGRQFNPVKWNADSIVALAKAAGMRSLVITSKHHDGFCMYHSAYTDFNIVEATPYKKDIVKTLADACHKANMGFGIYFSLIDWHFPQAYPISSHNADPITPQHHQYNLKQVTELMTNYGKVSEIWFDMGSLTPRQSKELYNLVDSLQPNCMISGRLGNNYSDFVVMPDNDYPDYQIGVSWQTAASMFDETWGYRSWQKRGEVASKVQEKLWSLIDVVSKGGNYLLNIGPKPDGSVVDFEQQVLTRMGRWMQKNGEAIYQTSANPFPENFEWGDVTAKNNVLYLFLRENQPQSITLNNIIGKVKSAIMLDIHTPLSFHSTPTALKIQLKENSSLIPVVKITFEDGYKILQNNVIYNKTLNKQNATPVFGFSNPDYYCGYKTIIRYQWEADFSTRKKKLVLNYTKDLQGKQVLINIDNNKSIEMVLNSDKSKEVSVSKSQVRLGKIYGKRASGIFGHLKEENQAIIGNKNGWQEMKDFVYDSLYAKSVDARSGLLLLQEIEAQKAQDFLIDVAYGNGFYLILNGQYITANFDLERKSKNNAQVLLPLKKGKNQLLIKLYNRDAKQLYYGLAPKWDYMVLQQTLSNVNLLEKRQHRISLQLANPQSSVAPIELSNLSFYFE